MATFKDRYTQRIHTHHTAPAPQVPNPTPTPPHPHTQNTPSPDHSTILPTHILLPDPTHILRRTLSGHLFFKPAPAPAFQPLLRSPEQPVSSAVENVRFYETGNAPGSHAFHDSDEEGEGEGSEERVSVMPGPERRGVLVQTMREVPSGSRHGAEVGMGMGLGLRRRGKLVVRGRRSCVALVEDARSEAEGSSREVDEGCGDVPRHEESAAVSAGGDEKELEDGVVWVAFMQKQADVVRDAREW